jgi:hypothetical protein
VTHSEELAGGSAGVGGGEIGGLQRKTYRLKEIHRRHFRELASGDHHFLLVQERRGRSDEGSL